MDGTFVIAVDGPSGTGKSTVSRAVAQRLDAGYLDTGALYRIVTVHILDRAIDPADVDAVERSLAELDFESPTDPADQRHVLRGRDITARIRQDDVTAAVSAVAANPTVRAYLLDRQRRLARSGRMVVEGRDIGTVIAPDATVKIYLTADPAVRARRRLEQDAEAGSERELHAVAGDLARRDTHDSTRAHAPLASAADAVTIDSTDLTIDQTVAAIIDVAHAKGVS